MTADINDPQLDQVLQALLSRVRRALTDNFVGAYLQGSLAVGGFDQHSDVDFIVVTQNELSQPQVSALQESHAELHGLDLHWAKHLEGSYFPKAVLRDAKRRGEPLWYLDHGSRELIQSDHDNTLVVRWILRERGVVLAGPEPSTLIDPIADFLLQRDIWETIQEWGGEILEQSDRFNNRFDQGFIVLSYCRMLHDLQAGAIHSKREGTEWAKATLDPSWADLIDRAWDTRQDPAQSVEEPADPADFARTLELVQEAMQLADDIQSELQTAGWQDYYDRHKDRPPDDLLLEALERFGPTPHEPRQLHAIDLGCGPGNETLALLNAGWRVLAVDNQAAAIAAVRSAIGKGAEQQCEFRQASFENLDFSATDLIWAGYSLPFCHPDRFDVLWRRIIDSIRPGGRFAGQLFGVNDSWASEPEMNFHSAEQVERLLVDDFQVEHLDEVEHDGDSGAGPKHWHVFHLIVKKRER